MARLTIGRDETLFRLTDKEGIIYVFTTTSKETGDLKELIKSSKLVAYKTPTSKFVDLDRQRIDNHQIVNTAKKYEMKIEQDEFAKLMAEILYETPAAKDLAEPVLMRQIECQHCHQPIKYQATKLNTPSGGILEGFASEDEGLATPFVRRPEDFTHAECLEIVRHVAASNHVEQEKAEGYPNFDIEDELPENALDMLDPVYAGNLSDGFVRGALYILYKQGKIKSFL